jgi:hypothetical protein
MAFTYSKLAEVTVGSGGAATIAFSNIPQNYNDLILKFSGRSDGTESSGYADGILTFNGTTTNYSERMVYAIGTSRSSVSQSSTGIKWNFGTSSVAVASTFGNSEVYIPNYTSSTNKSVSVDTVSENNSATVHILALNAGLWSNTTAISLISIVPGSGSWVQYSTATLYGVKAEV